MKVLFLDPLHKFWEFFRGLTASPALIYLAAVARKDRDFDVQVFDASMEPEKPWDRTEAYLKKERPEVVLLTGSITAFWPDTVNCAKLVRETLPAAKIVTGGYISSVYWEQALADGTADFVVLGEGEVTMMELLRALKAGQTDFSGIDGLAWLKDGKPVQNAPRGRIADLDSLPPPAYDLFPMERYSLASFGGHVGFTVTFARGCVGSCTFCSESKLWQRSWRGHGAEYMVSTLETLRHKYGKKVFYVGDNDFLHDPGRTKAFIALMKRRKPDVLMWIQTTCANFIKNEALLKDLREIGVYQVMLGIESMSPSVLKHLNKPQNVSLVKQAVELAKRHEFILMGMVMWGAPWNTKQDLKDTLDYMVPNCDIIGPNAISPWPGTPYYERCEKEGAIEVRDLSHYNMLDCITRTAELSAAESDRYYKQVVGKALIFNMKALGSYFFTNKPLYRTYFKQFIKMGWSFMTNSEWKQENYQRFDDFWRARAARRKAEGAAA